MTTSVTERSATRHRFLYYGDMRLVPVDGDTNAWHIPGRETRTTEQLVIRASNHGITLRLAESSRDGQTVTRLN
jgi:hypothetical protein